LFEEEEGLMLAKRMSRIKPSVTLAVSGKAKEMAAKGIDIVDFSVGEPDFNTPASVKAAGIKAIEDNFTRYTVNLGIPELREAIAEKLAKENGLSYSTNEIMVTSGAKQALFNLVMAVLDEGDEIIIPTPAWVSYEPMAAVAGAKAVLVESGPESGFLMSPEQLRANLTDRTKALMLNNPSNPTGGAYSRSELEALADVLRDTNVLVIADEIYEKLVYDDLSFTSWGSLGAEWKERCVIVNGVSKAYAMTGWRIGYAAAPAELIKAMGKIQGHSTSNANAIAQKAAVEALRGPQDEVETMRLAFAERRDLMLAEMRTIPDVVCAKARGAFYLFPDWSAYLGRKVGDREIKTCVDLANYMIEEAHVAVVPGAGFGTDRGYLRFSYASGTERIMEGMRRVRDAAAQIK